MTIVMFANGGLWRGVRQEVIDLLIAAILRNLEARGEVL